MLATQYGVMGQNAGFMEKMLGQGSDKAIFFNKIFFF